MKMNDGVPPNAYLVETLAQQCLTYVVMHFEKFPISHLSLLPLSIRKDMLWALPIADVCQLEETSFVQGFDMFEYWCSALRGGDIGDPAIEAYLAEKDATLHAKDVLHGLVLSYAMDCHPTCFLGFSLPRNIYNVTYDIIALLYCVRKRCLKNQPACVGDTNDEEDWLIFPPRYHKHTDMSLRWREWFHDHDGDDDMDEKLIQDRIDAVMTCFKNQLPKYHGEIQIYYDLELKYAYYFRELVFLIIISSLVPLEGRGLEFVMTVVEEATGLEVLLIEFDDIPFGTKDERGSLDKLCSELSTMSTFLSNLRILKIQKRYPCPGHVVSQDNLNKLISAYLSAPTNHPQKLHICDTVIKIKDISLPAKMDGKYLHFKTIEFYSCQFEVLSHQRVMPRTIETSWLGKDINVVESDCDSCRFKVEP